MPLTVSNLTKSYVGASAKTINAVSDVSFVVEDGSFLAIVAVLALVSRPCLL